MKTFAVILAVASSVAMADQPPPTFNKSSDLCPRQSPVQLEQRSAAELLADRCAYRDMGRRSMAVGDQTADPDVKMIALTVANRCMQERLAMEDVLRVRYSIRLADAECICAMPVPRNADAGKVIKSIRACRR
jgi:hypothetical protein